MPGDLLLFLTTGNKKTALFVKLQYICAQTFRHSPNRTSTLHSLHALPVAVLAIAANSAAHSLSNVHTFALTQMPGYVYKSFVRRDSMASSMKFTFPFFKTTENFWFLTLPLIISSDESQSKAQFNPQSSGENMTGYRTGNKLCFQSWKPQEICLHCIFIPSWKRTAIANELVIILMLCCC